MTTSGNTTLELNRDKIIAAAMRKCQALAKGQTPDAEDILNNTEALNNLVAEFMVMGMPLWAKRSFSPTLVDGQSTYTLTTPFPLRVIQGWIISNSGGSRQDLLPVSDYDINQLPESSSGIPNQYSYQPLINQGVLTVWPTPDATAVSDYTMTIRYLAPFDVFVNSTDTPFFPREWNNALIYGLAVLIAPEYGMPLNDRGMLAKEADAHLVIAVGAGDEYSSVLIQPAMDM